MKKLLLCLFMMAAVPAFSQSFDPGTLENITEMPVIRTDTFSGKNLWEHLGKNADLFLEYGCRELYSREYISNQDVIRLEVYVMKDEPSAFGIYKLAVTECIKLNTLTDFSCQSLKRTMAAYGTLFISIDHPSGTAESVNIAGQLVRAVVEGNKQDRMTVPGIFKLPKVNKFLFNLRYFEGPMGLHAGLPEWGQLFDGLEFRMFAEKVISPDTAAIVARIIFPSNADMTMFLSNAGLSISDRSTSPALSSGGLYHSWYFIDDNKILFLETKIPVSVIQYFPELSTIKKSVWDFENQ